MKHKIYSKAYYTFNAFKNKIKIFEKLTAEERVYSAYNLSFN